MNILCMLRFGSVLIGFDELIKITNKPMDPKTSKSVFLLDMARI